MRKIILTPALAGLLALLPGCVQADTSPAADWQGAQAQSKVAESLVAQDDAGWQRLWQKIGQNSPMSLPAGKTAVAVFAGQKRTGGYSVEFTGVTREKDHTTVTYRIKKPRFDQMVTQVLTAPYAVMLVPQSDKPVVLEEVR